jgi:protein-tyrosine phosphatase
MKILFVCSGNAYRSPVAEALLKKLKPDLKVESAGTNPMIPISNAAKEFLARENALTFLKHAPEEVNRKNLREYDLIIVMEPRHKHIVLSKCPDCANKIVVWNIEDPYFLPYGYAEKVFRQIKEKVAELAHML